MRDSRKTKAQLIEELEQLRRQTDTAVVERRLAIERIRAEAMSMRSSDDLLKVVAIMFREMRNLGIRTAGCSFFFVNEGSNLVEAYIAYENPHKYGISWTNPELIEIDAEVVAEKGESSSWLGKEEGRDFLESWRRGEAWTFEIDKADYDRGMARLAENSGMDRPVPYDDDYLMVTNIPFEHGAVGYNEPEFREENIPIIREFTDALSLGYIRFLDFQNLEEQNRRLARESAYERIRARILDSRSTEDLLEVASLIVRELNRLGVRFSGGIGLNFIDEEAGEYRQLIATEDESSIPRSLSLETIQPLVERWRRGETWMRPVTPDLRERWLASGLYDKYPERAAQVKVVLDVPFTHGTLAINSTEVDEFSAEEIEILQGFARVVSLAYTRSLDFQQLEEQNRQLAREAAVERVRSTALAMRSSDDLLDVVGVMYRELLRVDPRRSFANIWFVDREADQMIQSLAAPHPGQFGQPFLEGEPDKREISDEVAAKKFPRGEILDWESLDQPRISTFELTPETLEAHEDRGKRKADLSPEAIERKRQHFLGKHHLVTLPFAHGNIELAQRQEITEEDIELLRQFSEALSLGFVRYLDIKRADEAQQRLIDEMEEELQTAHKMQMNLMPTESPEISGLDIAGRCLTANHVGGDFFQYFPRDGKLALTLADVTGHAMEAAIPAVMFSGILDNQMEIGGSLEELYARLNRSMHRNLDSRTYVCFTMAELDLKTRTARLANGGCPYPYHYRAADNSIAELQVEAYPLGVQPNTEYPAIDVQLSSGDRLIFCSDGIVEAEDDNGELFGFERTAKTILEGCRKNLAAENLLDYIFTQLKKFTGDVPQGDDQTAIALCCVDGK